MILTYAIILLILLALLLRRDLNVLGQLAYRGNWKLAIVVFGLFALQWSTVIFAVQRNLLHMLLLILSHLALIFVFFLNRHIPGAKLFALGIILNTLVMAANGGWMPVTPEMEQFVHPTHNTQTYTAPPKSKNIVLPRSETNLWILSDNIPVTLPWRNNAISIGDVLLVAGVAQFLFQGTAKKQEHSPLKTTP